MGDFARWLIVVALPVAVIVGRSVYRILGRLSPHPNPPEVDQEADDA